MDAPSGAEQSLLYGEEQALYIAAEDGVEMRFVDSPKWSVSGDPCICKDDIELALIFFDLFEQPIQIAEFRNIALYSGDIRPNLFHRLIQAWIGVRPVMKT